MKQNITPQQLSQLSDKGIERLREWWKPNNFDLFYDIEDTTHDIVTPENIDKLKDWKDIYPLLSIGQMIELLEDEWMRICVFNKSILPIYYRKGSWSIEKLCIKHEYFPCYEQGCTNNTDSSRELCDTLWSACVEILNRE